MLMLKEPFIMINFKTYKEGTGKNAENLVKKLSKIKGNIVFCPQIADLKCLRKYNVKLFAQHVDPIDFGKHTGWILPESLKEAGAIGTLINHSEHPLSFDDIKRCISACKRAKLISVVCSPNKKMSELVAKLNPDYIAIEPPELIETGIAVSQARPKLIYDSVAAIKKVSTDVKVICGAGITKGEDVKRALELGVVGVLVSSAILKAKNPENVLEDMVKNANFI
ncbi:MAG: triose-phosphate isomerase [Candidatus Aenigmarchaeota archaeon]|nr:triose-phosphate isomerase [Candidatus Aenigmarchaeota archaeon]MCX8179583.1 triose-phosphate isomerase [Candidatus Aenigmarchaeota archaeon]